MNCNKARVLMSAAVDGELSLKEKQEFFVHLEECSECNEEFGDAKKTKMIIKERIVQFKAPQSLINAIMELSSISTAEHEETLLFE
jgi:anti-sigma factor RsiW